MIYFTISISIAFMIVNRFGNIWQLMVEKQGRASEQQQQTIHVKKHTILKTIRKVPFETKWGNEEKGRDRRADPEIRYCSKMPQTQTQISGVSVQAPGSRTTWITTRLSRIRGL